MTPAEHDRAAWQAFERLVRQLLAAEGLSLAGLDLVRHQLKFSGDWGHPGRPDVGSPLPADLQPRQQLLLHDVTTACAAARGIEHWPFPSDQLPPAPDDASGLDPRGAPGGPA